MKLLDTVTGVTVEVSEDVACADHEDHGEYQWTEGNYSCDCNRALFHARARGVPDPPSPPCGDERFELSEAPWMDVNEARSEMTIVLREMSYDKSTTRCSVRLTSDPGTNSDRGR